MKQTASQWLIDIAVVVAGTLLVASGLVMFTIPNNIAPGGVSGLATALAHISPLRVGLWTFLLNVPLVILALWKLGFKPLIKTLIGTVLLSFFIDLLTPILPAYVNNPLLAAVLGGVIMGVGMGIIFLRGATTGGTDLISMMLNRVLPNVSMGSLLLCVDSCVIIFAMIVFRDIEVALYSIVTLFVTTKMIDSIMQGVDYAKVVYVVTENGGALNQILAQELGRGVTIIDGRGGYSNRGKQVLMVVTRRNVLTQTLRAIKQHDKNAFIFVTNAVEVHGEGFKPMDAD